MSTYQPEALLKTLEQRFNQHRHRHVGLQWAQGHASLIAKPKQLQTLWHMEHTGGEPDVIGVDPATGAWQWCDCAQESPAGRRSLCYDRAAWDARKDNKPTGNVMDTAAAMGATLLTEAQYRYLQTLGEFDLKTSSWINTPAPIRALGGALFCDRRYDTVFTYHNGVQSYYSARGFRVMVNI